MNYLLIEVISILDARYFSYLILFNDHYTHLIRMAIPSLQMRIVGLKARKGQSDATSIPSPQPSSLA